jgi:uncharacterized protein YukE
VSNNALHETPGERAEHEGTTTNMSMYGANPEQLSALGNTLKQQVDPINSLMTTVSGVLSNTTWTGPARDQFESDWNTTFKSALLKLNSAFEAAGADCISRSENLRVVMGAR